MAPIACPHCGFQNSDIAPYCGECERPIKSAAGSQSATSVVAEGTLPEATQPQPLNIPRPAPLPVSVPVHPSASSASAVRRAAAEQASSDEILVEPAAWWRQLAGRIIDTTVLLLVGAAVVAVELLFTGTQVVFENTWHGIATWTHSHAQPLLHGTAVAAGVGLIYAFELGRRSGQTVGRKLTGTVIVRMSGRPLSWVIMALRTLASVISLALFGAGYLWIIIDPAQRTWHDIIAGTVVVKRKVRFRV